MQEVNSTIRTREELLQRARERDKSLETAAIEAERDGDTEGCWFAMATRAENARFIAKLEGVRTPYAVQIADN